MSELSTKINAGLGIWGDDLDPDECTRFTGVSPTKVEIKGQLRPEGRPPVRVTTWGISIERKNSYSIDEVLTELLDLIWPQREAIIEYLAQHSVSAIFAVNVTLWKERPEYCLGAETLRRLAHFGVEYCLDIFDYREE